MTFFKRRMRMHHPLPLIIGFFLIAAGLYSCNKNDDSSDDITGDWKRSSEFDGSGRSEAVTFTIGDTVYVGSGYDGDDCLSDFWYFNKIKGYWQPIANFPGAARNSAIAFSVTGKGYVGTGVDDEDTKLKDFWEYDPAKDTWTRKTDFAGTARYGAVGFSINGKGYVATGYDGKTLKDLWEYNPALDSWEQRASPGGSKRLDAAVFVYNNQAYLVSGINNNSYLNDFWKYDPATDYWEEKRKINSVSDDDYDDDYGSNITRSNATLITLNNKAYLIGGSYNGVIGTVWEYSIDADTWLQKTSFEGSAREGGLGFSMEGSPFVIFGSNSSYHFDDMWEFFPNAEQDDNNN